jgi:hypothetical protein
VLFAGLLGVAGAITSVFGFEIYGWGLFVALPVVVGFFGGLPMAITGASAAKSAAYGVLAALVTGLILFALALEGLICLVMAAPLWMPLAAIGGLVAWWMVNAAQSNTSRALAAAFFLVLAPALMGAEFLARPEAPVFEVVSSVEIDASPERVWNHVISFGELPAPTELIFRGGVAYPIRAEIHGRGVGALRHCVFNTGAFVEPIEAWDEPRLLGFRVTQNPRPMHELSPYSTVHAPHLHGFFTSQRGQFRLVALAGGRTRLEGTTWYQHHMWPAAYWQLWSDWIIHQIHLRVLGHVKNLSETRTGA